jgi:membrane protein CcdC involved in cytochrome C biogenesis
MYSSILIIHSWARWLVVIFAVIAIYRAFSGWRNKDVFQKQDGTIGAMYVGTIHLQIILGLLLYFWLSPVTEIAFSDFGAAMKNSTLRFWAVEHITGMIIAAVVAQIGRIKSKKAEADIQKHKKAFIFYLISFIIILLSMPYIIRPLFRI